MVECVPPGVGVKHWEELIGAPKLVDALDEVLGRKAWELPANSADFSPGTEYIRQWYAPVVFPEPSVAEQAAQKAKPDMGDEEGWRNGEGDGWAAEEDRMLLATRSGTETPQSSAGNDWKAVAAAVGNGRSAKQCRERWCGLQPWTAAGAQIHSSC
eukprot:COSAG05_NODE_105_length_18793_cov_115.346421_2_plen_156_part_00